VFKGLCFFVQFSWRHKRSYLLLNILNQLIAGILPLVIIAVPKYIIDELMSARRIPVLAGYVAVLLGAVFLNNWLTNKLSLLIFPQRCGLSAEFGEYMHEKLVNTDYYNLESPDFYDMKEKANKFLYGDWHGFCFVLESALSIFGKSLTAIGIIAIISTMNPWLVLLFLGMVALSAVIDYRSKKKAHQFSLDAVEWERRWNYYTRILEDAGYSKEIRMNQIGRWLIDREKSHAYGAIEFYKKHNKYFARSGFWSELFNLIQNGLTYFYLIGQVVAGYISIGNFTMYVSAVTAFSSAIKAVLTNILDVKVYGIYYDALDRYLNIEETMRRNQRLPLSEGEPQRIEFRHVSFRYPGQEQYALKDVNLTITGGMKLSIVGENGSGKTTFIKLLCRLYDPTEGEILYNGVNIRDLDYDRYMELYAAVFQDFKLFSFSVLDNVAWDDTSERKRQRAMDALTQLGLKEKLDSLPKGADTMVYKEFDREGFEPSGGEAQRIAIARAMAKDARIVILDEPLSALDPKAWSAAAVMLSE